MKKHILLFAALWCGFFSLPVLQTGCSTPVDQRVQTVQTLKIVGQSAKATVDSAAQLLAQGSISVESWNKIASVYDNNFQPTYALAVAAARSDLSTPASPDLIGIAAQLAALVAQLTSK